MPERFVQIVIAKNDEEWFHVTLQDETHVVESRYFSNIVTADDYVEQALLDMDIPSQAKRFEQA